MRKAFFAIFLCLILSSFAPALADHDRPVNFIFLLDVSGSMLYKSEMVPSANGQKVFLFEALRQALAQTVQDPRLIGPLGKTCVITFGTKVDEKSNWPEQLETDADRQKLVQLIQSPEALQADKHGDTYMGGALAMALDKANKMYAGSDPCTTTFVVMLTDGWDEPPAGASIKVKDAAAKFVARSKEIQKKLGVKTWQCLVIGLQDLPDRKAGTTTAKELAGLLDGEFIDVTKQAGGTVSDKIFLALKRTVENLQGAITISPSASRVQDGILRFGTVDGNGFSTAGMLVGLVSCYAEQITGVSIVPNSQAQGAQKRAIDSLSKGSFVPASELPPGALTVSLNNPNASITPEFAPNGERRSTLIPYYLDARAGGNCPPGHYVGTLKLTATAKIQEYLPFEISVPARIVTDHHTIGVVAKKTGVFKAESCECSLEDSLKDTSGSTHGKAVYTVTLTPESARLASEQSSKKDKSNNVAEATIDSKHINQGQPLTVTLDLSKVQREPFRLDVFIPADQQPGRYEGKLDVKMTGSAESLGPTEIPYEIIVEPSPWEKVAPIAIPVFLLCIITCALWFFFWMRTLRR
jgi:hypothetical protein